MDIKEVNIESEDGKIEITHLEGRLPEPLPLHEKKRYVVAGTIDAPAAYLKTKHRFNADWNDDSSKNMDNIVVHFSSDGSITLFENPNDDLADKVTGELRVNPIFAKLGINSQDTNYDIEGLRKAIRGAMNLFPSAGAYKATMTALQDVKMRVNSEYTNERSNTANVKGSAHRLTDEWNHKFEIKAPIHVGTEPQSITIDILVDVSSTPRFYLESIELVFAEHEQREKIIDENLAVFHAENITVIQTD